MKLFTQYEQENGSSRHGRTRTTYNQKHWNVSVTSEQSDLLKEYILILFIELKSKKSK